MQRRGLLIVFEGIDRCGKTTQSSMLLKRLCENGIKAKKMSFPARHTEVGSIINRFLQKQQGSISNESMHLIFSANRWELMHEIREALLSGVTLLVDRYAFSGVAYSVAALGLDYEWCKSPDKGIIEPDAVFYLSMPPESCVQRDDFGNERYEKLEIQKKVYDCFTSFSNEPFWTNIKADRDIMVIHEDIWNATMKALSNEKLVCSATNLLWSTGTAVPK